MTDAVRSYGGRKNLGARGVRRRRGRLRWGILAILFAAFLGGCWLTRDTYPSARLLPADQQYLVRVTDLAGQWREPDALPFGGMLPAGADFVAGPERVIEQLGLPQWNLNNLIGRHAYFTGNDLKTLRDALFVTKMTRTGVLIERFRRLGPNVTHDAAGGLDLHKAQQAGLYYAVRGRVLVASASRDALIKSLTTPDDACVGEEALARAFPESGAGDALGKVQFAEGFPLDGALSSVRFALRMDGQEARLKCRATLHPRWAERLNGLLAGATPQELLEPLPGVLRVSANTGKHVREVWTCLGAAFVSELFSEKQWSAWESGEEVGLSQSLTRLVGKLGPGLRLSWCGVDLNEMAPVPEIVCTVDASGVDLDTAFETLAGGTGDGAVVYDAEKRVLHMPTVGGPSVEPTAVRCGAGLLLSSSRQVAERTLADGPAARALPEPGNLYVQVDVEGCLEKVVAAGRLLAENHLLRGHTPESFERQAEAWQERTAKMKDVSALFSHEQGEIVAEFVAHLVEE